MKLKRYLNFWVFATHKDECLNVNIFFNLIDVRGNLSPGITTTIPCDRMAR